MTAPSTISHTLEERWPRVLLPALTAATVAMVVTGNTVALEWITVALLVLPLLGALGRAELRPTATAYGAHLAAFALFVAARSVADDLGAPVQVQLPIVLDRLLGLGELPTVRLQSAVRVTALPAWLDRVVFTMYSLHFFVIWLVCFALWERGVPRLRQFCFACAVAYALALPVHALLPTAPPWMAARLGAIPPVVRVFEAVGQQVVPNAVREGISLSGNDVAALPSLHMTITWLMLSAVWSLGRPYRIAGTLYTLLMTWSIVYGAEHYVFDVLTGVLLAVVARHVTAPWGKGAMGNSAMG